jgi:hypothetical protein
LQKDHQIAERVRELLDQMPERPPRSKLEPHAEVIRELRRKRRTYLEIAAFFREHLQISVAPSTIHDFVKTRARRAKSQAAAPPELPVPEASLSEIEQPLDPAPAAVSPDSNPSKMSVLERIKAREKQPIPTKPEARLFDYDPEK